MSCDLSGIAGFTLYFDAHTRELATEDGMRFEGKSRRAVDLAGVLCCPDAVAPNTELYRTYGLLDAPACGGQALQRYGLTLGLVMLPPLRIGREYNKTAGHYHPAIPGSAHAYPEVYSQLHGRLLLLLQKRRPADPIAVDHCVLVESRPGFSIVIPPGYAHALINQTSEAALLVGLYGRAFEPDYAPVRARRGLAYYVLADDEGFETARNPSYPERPPLRRLGALAGTPFAPPHAGEPVWQSFLQRPDEYAFLTQPGAVEEHFSPEGLRWSGTPCPV